MKNKDLNFNFDEDRPLEKATNKLMEKLKRRGQEPFLVKAIPDDNPGHKTKETATGFSAESSIKNNQKKLPKGMTLKMAKEKFGHDEDIKFLYRDVLPMSMPVMLAGREGSGKTTNALQIAKEIIDSYDAGYVIWLATEGAVLDTIDKASKIGLDNPRFVFAQKADETFKFEFSRQPDLKELDTLLKEIGGPVLAVFIDSIRGMSKFGDSDDANGRIMHTINAIVCDKYKATLIYLDHHKKGAAANLLDKTSGSTSKTSAVRLVLAIENKSKVTRTIRPAKVNIFKEIPELESIQIGNKIHIRGLTQLNEQSRTEQCEIWLTELMPQKPEIWASEVYRLAKIEGFSESTVKKVNLPIIKKKIDKKWKWFWDIKD